MEDFELVYKQEEIDNTDLDYLTDLTEEERTERANKINSQALLFEPSKFKDTVRCAHASANGGFELTD